MKEILYCIYMFTSPSGKKYIGQTCNFNKRKSMHKRCASNCGIFINAIKKYGWDSFTYEILEEGLSLEEVNEREVYWIDFYNSLSPNGYNLMTGGNNSKHSEETCRKISETKKRQKLKRPHTKETRQKISNANSGKKRSEIQNKENKERQMGIPRSEEFKIKQSIRLSKYWIIIFPDEHEEIIFGLKQFCKNNNLNCGHMGDIANHKRIQHKGFKCRHATEQEILDITSNT